MDTTTFYFTKYAIRSLGSGLGDEEVKESLVDYVQTNGPVVSEEDETWYFGETQRNGMQVVGKFGRSLSNREAAFDEEKGDFQDEAVVNKKAEYAMFILDIESELLIYHTRDRIRHQVFRRRFKQGYEDFMNGTVTFNNELIRNDRDVDEVIRQHPVRRAEFRLRPSNPSSGPDWEDLDKQMKIMFARKLDIDVESEKGESLNFDEEILRQVYEASKSDYGGYDIYYDQDGELTVVSSASDEPIQSEEERPESLDDLQSRVSDLVERALAFL